MTSTNKYELAAAIDNILNSSSEVVDTVEKGHALRRKISQKLAFELDEYINLQIVPSVTGSILNVTNNFINSRIASSFPIDPAAHIPGLRTLGYTGNSAMPGNAAAGGDLSGNYPSPTVVGLYGRPVLSTVPTANYVLTWNGSAWEPAAAVGGGGSPTGAAGGDLGGTYPNPDVVALQSYAVASTAPTTNDVLTWSGSEWAPSAPSVLSSNLLFDLDTTVTTDLSSTTEGGVRTEYGTGPAGTLTITANEDHPAMPSVNCIKIQSGGPIDGILVRRVLAGTLPAEGFILEIEIANLTVDSGGEGSVFGVIMVGYEQETGSAPAPMTGFSIQFRLTASNTDLYAVGDNAGNYDIAFVGSGGSGEAYTLPIFQTAVGARKLVIEFRKLDNVNPAQWSIKQTVYSSNTDIIQHSYSAIANPQSAWSPVLAMQNTTFDRVGLGLRGYGTHNGALFINKFRIWSLDFPAGGTGSGSGLDELTGDVTAGPGTGAQAATVEGIQGNPVAATAPALNDVLTWDGSQWEPAPTQTGLLFELDTTVTTDLSATTEVQGKSAPGGLAFAGTVTPTGNVASPWDSDTKMLSITTSAAMRGIGLRQVECGTLPTEGFIVDVGIGDLDTSLTNTALVIAFYEQRTGVNGRGIGLALFESTQTVNIIGFADDNTDSPAINTSPLNITAADAWPSTLNDFNRGPKRAILEFRKVDTSSPERWTLRVTLYGTNGGVTSQTYSGIAYPATTWSTSLDLAGASMTRVGLGAWTTSLEGGDMSISHLRIYSLGSSLPT